MSQLLDLDGECKAIQFVLNQQLESRKNTVCSILYKLTLHRIIVSDDKPIEFMIAEIRAQLNLWMETNKAQWIFENVKNISVDGYFTVYDEVFIHIFSHVDDSVHTQYKLTWQD